MSEDKQKLINDAVEKALAGDADAINNIDGNTRLKDVIVIARDVLVPALNDEKAFEGDTETIKEKIMAGIPNKAQMIKK